MKKVMTTHLITAVGIFHVVGSREEIITKVNQYLHDNYCDEADDKPKDMWLHLSLFAMDAPGFFEEVAVNPSQIIMIGRSHEVDVPDDIVEAVVGDDMAEVVLGGA